MWIRLIVMAVINKSSIIKIWHTQIKATYKSFLMLI